MGRAETRLGGDGNPSANLAGAENVGPFVLGREGSILATGGGLCSR